MLTPYDLNRMCTYATVDEIDYMRLTMPHVVPPNGTIVMIGAGPGVLLFAFLSSELSSFWDITVIDINSCQWAKEHFKQGKEFVAKYADRINWIERDSYDVGMEWEGEIDLLIVDGDHSPEGVTRDCDAWLRHVRDGGLVMFHDYTYKGTQWEGLEDTSKVVRSAMWGNGGWNRKAIVGTSAIYKKIV